MTGMERLRAMLGKFKRGQTNQAIAVGDQGLVSGMNFLTNIVLLRALGIRQFGIYALAWAAVQFVYSIQLALVISPLLSRGPKQVEERRPEYFGATLLQQLAFAVLSSSALYLAARFAPGRLVGSEGAQLAGALAAACFCYCVQDFVRRLLFVSQRPWTAVVSDILSYAGQVALLVIFTVRHNLTIHLALVIAAVTSLLGALALAGIREVRFSMKRQIHMEHLLGNVGFSKWLFASSLLQWSAGNLFVIAVAAVLGPVGAGMLKLGQSAMGALHIWFQGMENFVPAQAAAIVFSAGPRAMREYLLRTAAAWGAPISLYLLAVALFPVPCLMLMYGRVIPHAAGVLRGFAFIYALMFVNSLLRIELRSLEKTRPIFVSYLIGTGVSFLLAFPVARAWGVPGAVAGLALQQVITMSVLGTRTATHSRRAEQMKREAACVSSTY